MLYELHVNGWDCGSCNMRNAARDPVCRNCGAAHESGLPAGTGVPIELTPAGVRRAGDWVCGYCGKVNESVEARCARCRITASEAVRRDIVRQMDRETARASAVFRMADEFRPKSFPDWFFPFLFILAAAYFTIGRLAGG